MPWEWQDGVSSGDKGGDGGNLSRFQLPTFVHRSSMTSSAKMEKMEGVLLGEENKTLLGELSVLAVYGKFA